MKSPNIILIVTDEMRGDCLGIAGHPDVKTPYIDSLANEGVYFPNAYSVCPTCVPARAVLHTGLTPTNTGRVGYCDGVEWNYESTMASELAKSGYYTQAVGKMHVSPLRNHIGFHHVDLHDGYLHHNRYTNIPRCESQMVADDYYFWLKKEKGIDVDVNDTGLDCNGWIARPWIYDEMLHPTNWATSKSIDFLRRRDRRKPFFLMTSYVRPHAPYDAPSWYFDLYKDKKLAPPLQGDWNDDTLLKRKGRTFNNITGPIDAEQIHMQQVGYYACITHIDHQIGRLMQALIEEQIMDNTIIIFTSDHGEMLSDHHFNRKSLPYKGSCHIPMILSGPEKLIGAINVINKDLVELRDIMPTCIDIAGMKSLKHLDGSSMLVKSNREYLHGEHQFRELSHQFIVTKTAKYIWFSQSGKEQYFDLVKDPNETHDGIKDKEYQKEIRELRKQLIKELKNRPEGYSDGSQLYVGCRAVDCLPNATSQ